jgi:FAD synthase
VSASNPLTIEAHLLGFEGDIYGSEMTLSFVERLRDERRFDDLASLQAQLKLDLQSLSQMK